MAATNKSMFSGTLNLKVKLKEPKEKDPRMVIAIANRFRQAVDKCEDTHKLRAIVGMCTREDLMGCLDDHGMDLLHYCILRDNAEAADFLLKQNYYARPHEPAISPYLHLAAFLGLKTMMTVLIQHRPDDFRIVSQPFLVPPEYLLSGGGVGNGSDSSATSTRSSGRPFTSTNSGKQDSDATRSNVMKTPPFSSKTN